MGQVAHEKKTPVFATPGFCGFPEYRGDHKSIEPWERPYVRVIEGHYRVTARINRLLIEPEPR